VADTERLSGAADFEDRTRNRLAISMVIVSVVGVTAVSFVVVLTADDTAGASRLVFTAVLPLFGTWVGTVLAYYFGREYLKTATESTARLLRLRSAESPVSEAMIPWQSMTKLEVTSGELPDLTLATVREKLKDQSRLPIVDKESRKAYYVVHRSWVNTYLVENPSADAATVKFDTFRASPQGSAVSAFGFISEEATVREARKVMGARPERKDIVVTESGQDDEPVRGWITDADLAGFET
jgi:hypothetical protein